MLYCGVLGSIAAFGDDGRELVIVSESQRRLLALLCLHANSSIRSVVMEERLGVSSGALRTSISRLRRTVGADAILTAHGAYTMRAKTDVAEFERLVRRAHASTADEARSDLERARTLWRGSGYEEFAHEEWARVESQRLQELHAKNMEALAILLLEANDRAGALDVIAPLISDHPYRDLPRALMMRAYHEAGRTTEALRQFQAYRAMLRDAVGTDPSDDLVALDRSIAANLDLRELATQGHPAWNRGHRPTKVEVYSEARLPTPVSSFVGRDHEARTVAELLASHRLVTLTGPGGSGKTRLALRLASTISRDGLSEVFWIDLGVLGSDNEVAEHVATEIGVVPGHDPITEIQRRLDARQLLLVFDNAEHVLDATAAVVSAVLTHCPHATALVTSRESLGVSGEVVWRVPAMALPEGNVTINDFERHDALRLFLTRAREARPGMAVDQRAVTHIVEICKELDGIPLALELAAARLRTLPLESVAQGVSEIIGWKSSDGRFALGRHRTLRASIEWSFGLINSAEQQMLLALAVFQCPFDVEAAEAITDSIQACDGADDVVGALADVGLLQFDDDRQWFRMLHTVRQFCLERVSDDGGRDLLESARARYFADWCEQVGAGSAGIDRRPFVTRMPDVAAAMTWARQNDRLVAYRICVGLAAVRSTLGHNAELVATWQWLMEIDVEERDPAWAEAVAGLLSTATGYMLDTVRAEGLALAELPAGPSRARSWLERGRAMVPAYWGRPERIQSYVNGLSEPEDDLEASIYVGFASYMHALTGQLDECDPLLERLRRLTRRHATTLCIESIGNGYAAAIVVDTLRGDLDLALDRGRRPVPTDTAFSITAAAALAHAALLARDQASMERALAWAGQGSIPILRFLTPFIACCAALLENRVEESADLAEDFWDQASQVPLWQVFALPLVNIALIESGRSEIATARSQQAAALLDGMSSPPLPTTSLHLAWAQIALAAGDGEDAERTALEALASARHAGLQLATIDALELVVEASQRQGVRTQSFRMQEAAAERKRLDYRFSMVPLVTSSLVPAASVRPVPLHPWMKRNPTGTLLKAAAPTTSARSIRE